MHCLSRSRACWCGSKARFWTWSTSLSILEARKAACDCGEPTQLPRMLQPCSLMSDSVFSMHLALLSLSEEGELSKKL